MYCAIRKCEGCGCELQRAEVARRWPKWCPGCHPRRKRAPAERQCERCGEQFSPTFDRNIYCKPCSPEAKKENDARRYLAGVNAECQCKQCGERYRPKHSSRVSYCSRECFHESKSQAAVARATADGWLSCLHHRSSQFACRICGTWSTRKLCSDECRMEEDRIRSRATCRAVPDVVACRMCGADVVRVVDGWCVRKGHRCDECRAKASKAQRKKGRVVRKAKKRGHPLVRPESIIEHDVFCSCLWVCGICGDTVDHSLPPGHPLSAEMDHIKPLSRWGTHTRDNAQCTHRICNQIKSDHDQAVAVHDVDEMRAEGLWEAWKTRAVDKWIKAEGRAG